MAKQKIVIVGGGFGGIKTALMLAKSYKFDITLVSDLPDFRVYPALYRVSTGGAQELADIPLTELFAGKPVKLVIEAVKQLDKQAKQVVTVKGTKIDYDYLVLSLGVITNYFHIEGLEEFAYGIKSLEDAEKLKHHLHQQLIDQQKPDMNYVVIGAGPTGVELASALPFYIKKIAKQHGLKPRPIHVDLVEAAPRILPRSPKDVSRMVHRRLRRIGVKIYLNTVVQAQTADALMANNKPIRSHTVIWTAGVTNHPLLKEAGFQEIRNGKVRVNQYLQAEPGIYVIGDNADTPYSGVAQTALYDAKYVARSLIRQAKGKEPRPYRAVEPAYVIPVGEHWAVLMWRQLRIYGWLAWMLRSAADLMEYHDYQPFRLAIKRWEKESSEEEECPRCFTLNRHAQD